MRASPLYVDICRSKSQTLWLRRKVKKKKKNYIWWRSTGKKKLHLFFCDKNKKHSFVPKETWGKTSGDTDASVCGFNSDLFDVSQDFPFSCSLAAGYMRFLVKPMKSLLVLISPAHEFAPRLPRGPAQMPRWRCSCLPFPSIPLCIVDHEIKSFRNLDSDHGILLGWRKKRERKLFTNM